MSAEPLHVTLLHTNDMHAHLEAMSRLSTFAGRLRAELRAQGRRVFFFDAGDAADRSVRFCSLTKGGAVPGLLSAMGYDLQALGNAISLTYGPQAVAEMAARADFPLLAANLCDGEAARTPNLKPCVELPLAEGLKLGVLGLTVHSPQGYALYGLRPPDFREAARAWVEKLAGQGAGPLVAVSHLGLENDRRLAEAVPALDVILGGHSHSLLPQGERVNGVLIAQAGEYAQHLGRVDLEIDARTGAVLSKTATVVEIPVETPPDLLVNIAIREAEREAEELLARPLALLAGPLSLEPFAECGLGDLAADALRERMGAEAALLSGGLFQQGLPGGRVTLGDLDAACSAPANPQLSRVRGEQIVAALEDALEPERMHSRLKAFRGAPLGLPMLSGLRVEADLAAEKGARVKAVSVGGQPLEGRRAYLLAHTDAEVKEENLPFGYLRLEAGQLLRTEVPTILREALEEYLKAHSPVPPPAGGRWISADHKLTPEG